jgi:drug/metabolite transporter (DMT)-like permease
MYIALCLVAAMLVGFAFVLQQQAAQQVRSTEFLRLGLIAKLVHNRRWLAGIGILIVGDLAVAWTLGHLRLSVSEPLLTTNLIFALLLAVPLSHQTLRRTEIIGAVLLSAGVTALSLSRSVRAPSASFGSFSHWPAAGVIALIAVLLVRLGWRRKGAARATLTGAAAGLFLGIADSFTRLTVQLIMGRNPLQLLVHWPGYATIMASIIGVWLMQNAFNSAPLHASLPAVTAAEPLAGIVLGVVVYGDVIHITPLLLAVQAAGLAAMIGGVILVARAPVFSNLHLRELPQAALERVQHPAGAHASGQPPARERPDGSAPEPPPRDGPGCERPDQEESAASRPASSKAGSQPGQHQD